MQLSKFRLLTLHFYSILIIHPRWRIPLHCQMAHTLSLSISLTRRVVMITSGNLDALKFELFIHLKCETVGRIFMSLSYRIRSNSPHLSHFIIHTIHFRCRVRVCKCALARSPLITQYAFDEYIYYAALYHPPLENVEIYLIESQAFKYLSNVKYLQCVIYIFKVKKERENKKKKKISPDVNKSTMQIDFE